MVTVLYLEAESFEPLDAVPLRLERDIEAAPAEEQQAYRTARVRDRSLARAYYEVLWGALRTYFGEEYLPPLAPVEAYCAGNERPYRQWNGQVDDPDQTTAFCYDRKYERLYVSVDHETHYDLLLLSDLSLKLYFCPFEGRHTDVVERFFRPLLAECARRGLSPANQHLLVAFVDGVGLRTAHLPVFLEQVGLG